ncbi:MAG: hypothetical protein JWO00_367, partial [Candidatus Parcubacteria bacterium]|nr:hypothetical protein [Candidatus Parcubacteria bacterium]
MKQTRRILTRTSSFIFFALTLAFAFLPVAASADEASDLQAKINQRNTDIQSLEKEIKDYQSQIATLNGQESTLTSAIQTLTLTEKK